MITQKTCFVISPIGDEGSEIREEADALLWIIRQALEKYRFKVVRIDEIPRSTKITPEILRYVRESALCIIILTGENPNVFYEAGRRHETSKPYIQLIRKDEEIPFDIADIRTILYDDVDSRASVAKTIAEIQRFVDEFEDSGWPRGSGTSLPVIAASLDRIERQLSLILGGAGTPIFVRGISVQQPDSNKIMEFLFKNPRDAFEQAVQQGDLYYATRAAIRLEELIGPSEDVLQTATVLVQAYHEPGVDIIIRLLTEHLDRIGTPSDQAIMNAIEVITTFYVEIKRPTDFLTKVKPVIELLIEECGTDLEARSAKAYYVHQLSYVYSMAGDYEEALPLAQEAVRLSPQTELYLLVLSVIYRNLENYEEASKTVDNYIELDVQDSSSLLNAIDIYKSAGHLDKICGVYAKIEELHPDEAEALVQNPEMKDIIENCT